MARAACLMAGMSSGCADEAVLDGPNRRLGWTARELELVEQAATQGADLCLRVKKAGGDWETLRCVAARHRTLATFDEYGIVWLYSGDVGTYWYWSDDQDVWHEVAYDPNGPADRRKPPPQLAASLRR